MGAGDIPVVEVKNELASAVISLQGAHVLSWIPVGEKDVIWLSDDASFAVGKSVRGGIPICWPWFGAHETSNDFPAHGFARTVAWTVIATQQLNTGETQVTFKLDTKELERNQKNMWPQATVAEYRITIGKKLSLELITSNNSEQVITIGQALHTYFSVDDVKKTTLSGLEGKDYLDKTASFNRKTQVGNVSVNNEIDRIYLNTPDTLVIDDSKRKIIISKQGSLSTVVWNPWEEVANKMGDLGKDGYFKMLCVESANAAEDTVSIQPNETHTLHVTYEVG
ncbi:MAG: D-hexose-6-phosphate mutarotase [Bacteroidetes bacterium]|nr:D-hexose-6-phosphate mutarotase [Bacteroidota bacterium]